ncbi:MAG: PQQ-binding-like beta-propeller repeat protein [Thermoanaerobaculia bacterium]|nr:PQQ-binding-like beta-propeller repeat protein [Thermoanaerobaculia bacterium]
MRERALGICLSTAVVLLGGLAPVGADEIGMFANSPSRNMISEAENLPSSWDPSSGENVKWKQELGSQSYGGPVLAGGVIYVGTNNERPRDPSISGDKGVLMAFRASDGEFLWQKVHDKLPAGRVHDWPLQGICSGPYVNAEAGRLYYVSNRAEVVCATTDGETVWMRDMIEEMDVFPHNLAAGNPLVVGDIVFTVTGNGVDEGHINIPEPRAPSFLALDKNTGETIWSSYLPGNQILHGQWSNPAYGVIDGVPQVIFPGGDGWIYSLVPETGEVIWKFDANPKDSVWELGGAGTRNNIISTPVVYEDRVYIGVGQDPEHGEAPGHFWVIDATGRGDVTETHVVWHRGGEEFGRTISTAAIADDIVYIADLSGFLYALDADTGEHYWTYDAFAAVWGSAFVADGKVYLGDEDGDVAILVHGKEMELLEEINMGASVYTTPIAEDGTLYIASRNMLWALSEGD